MRSFTDRLAEFFSELSGPEIHPFFYCLVDENPIHLSCKLGPKTHPILFYLNMFLNHIEDFPSALLKEGPRDSLCGVKGS